MRNGFDRLARPYRWLEYLTFGLALERCRFRFLASLCSTRCALVLGDGDGRFAARLLQSAPSARLLAIDASSAMLRALKTRCEAIGAGDRASTCCADLTQPLPLMEAGSFDLVTSHFVLDCLSTAEIAALAERVRPLLRKDARWIVSEFDVPDGAMKIPAAAMVRLLYLAFRVLTGLRTQELPRYRPALEESGFICGQRIPSLGGLLMSEEWLLRS